MEKNLFVFGCSYTADFESTNIPDYSKYKIWKGGYFPPTWPELLSEKLGYKLYNYGVASSGNQKIFRTFCEHVEEYKKGDMIILQWSYMHRYEWANLVTNDFFTLGTGKITKGTFMLESTHEDIITNRSSSAYQNEILIYMNLINRFCDCLGIDLFFWSGDYDFIYGHQEVLDKYKTKILLGDVLIKGKDPLRLVKELGGQEIQQETNNEITDGHLAESGHLILSNLFYNHIKLNEK